MPDAVGLEVIAGELRERYPESVLETSFEHGAATLIVDSEQALDVLRWLRDWPEQRYRFLASLHAADYLPFKPRFAVHYELLSMERAERLHVKALLSDPGGGALPAIDSCVELFPTADFQEREAYDFFGIEFRGHPDLTRILMPEDYVGWPQRRDFPIGGEPVIFTNTEREVPGWTR
jgi:NADH-quinone oxidoreductase subunit C